MRLRVGYELAYECPQSTPMLLMLSSHRSRARNRFVTDHINTHPWVPLRQYQDSFGNLCTRLTAPPGVLTLSARGVFDVPPDHERLESNGYQHTMRSCPTNS